MDSTSVSLLGRLQTSRDDRSWRRFAELYTPLLLHWCRRAGVTQADADEVAQEVLLAVYEKLSGFERRRDGSFRFWLRTVTFNKCRERQRRKNPAAPAADSVHWSGVGIAATGETPLEAAEYSDRLVARALQLMQSEFEPNTWKACWEHVVSGKSAAEIGAALGMSEGAVYVAKSRVLRRLREELGDFLE